MHPTPHPILSTTMVSPIKGPFECKIQFVRATTSRPINVQTFKFSFFRSFFHGNVNPTPVLSQAVAGRPRESQSSPLNNSNESQKSVIPAAQHDHVSKSGTHTQDWHHRKVPGAKINIKSRIQYGKDGESVFKEEYLNDDATGNAVTEHCMNRLVGLQIHQGRPPSPLDPKAREYWDQSDGGHDGGQRASAIAPYGYAWSQVLPGIYAQASTSTDLSPGKSLLGLTHRAIHSNNELLPFLESRPNENVEAMYLNQNIIARLQGLSINKMYETKRMGVRGWQRGEGRVRFAVRGWMRGDSGAGFAVRGLEPACGDGRGGMPMRGLHHGDARGGFALRGEPRGEGSAGTASRGLHRRDARAGMPAQGRPHRDWRAGMPVCGCPRGVCMAGMPARGWPRREPAPREGREGTAVWGFQSTSNKLLLMEKPARTEKKTHLKNMMENKAAQGFLEANKAHM
ncbi:hypothetical protein DFH07DRAFT_774155 [Mycena maculata]|uniref:Uncharacterized protein n=1 Tax=Mycena maculata TaxID=230809 RepID=A0AAD7IYT1_9AGAR|nr:hypothetical protein DFH07DRAFT_774155 [Mycena maculata]